MIDSSVPSQDAAPSPQESPAVKPRSRKGMIIAGSLIGITLLGLGGGAFGLHSYYADRALPGTSIAGEDISGLSGDQVRAVLAKHTADIDFSFQVGSETVTASRAELGIEYDLETMYNQAMSPSQSLSSIVSALLSSTNNVEPSVTLNEEKLSDFSGKLALKAGPVVKQASISASANGEFTVNPAVVGKAVNMDKLKTDLLAAAQTLQGNPVIIAEVSDVEPTITTADAEAVVADAKALAEQEISVSDGIDIFSADAAVRKSWVIVPESADGTKLEAPRFDEEKVKQWVDKTAKDSNVEPVPTYNNVNASGKVLVEGAKPGRKGYKVNNADKVLAGIMEASSQGQPYAGEFTYDEIAPPVENRQVLPGAENMAYPAAEGEKWLEINLGSNSVSAYIGTDRVRGPIPIVPGAPGHETVTGLFHIYLKYEKQDMGCTPEWPYCAKDVPWVSYFHGSYAFHGAPWQESFGWSGEDGSHGCVNMPVPEAQWVHQWSEMGTPVVSHY